MFSPQRLHTPPSNLHDFVAEIRPPFEHLWGPKAGEFYRATAPGGLGASVVSASISAYGSMDGDRAAGLLFVRQEGRRAALSFFHMLAPFRATSLANQLVDFALSETMKQSDEIVTEFVPFDECDWEPVFEGHGFRTIARQIMRREAVAVEAVVSDGVRLVSPDGLDHLAGILAESYAADSGRFLFPEVQSADAAHAYLRRVARGEFGRHIPSYTIGASLGGARAGFAIGSDVLPGVGFILHMAVHPSYRRRGVGRSLLSQLCSNFASQGLDYIALGVTCDNPAVKLYEKAGFEHAAQVPVFFWSQGP